MLQIHREQNHLRRNILLAVALLLLIGGIYILLVIFSPAVITGQPQGDTVKKLDQKPGTNGDRLYIPQIDVNIAIVEGDNEGVLEKGAWHRRPENGNPEKGGNFVLSAHRFVMSYTPQGTALRSPFYNIGKLVEKDKLFVDYHGKRYEYVIKRKYTVAPSAVEIEAPSETAKLTLYSCTLEGSTDGRDVIEAVPVPSQSS